MPVNPDAFTILCFGDSNTFGQRPVEGGRWPLDVRWTGQLQDLLGDQFRVIEEGLGGRTTDLNDPQRAGRNGRAYLNPCLRSHSPLDMVVLMLGTNDLKTRFDRTPTDVAEALAGLVDDIEQTAWNRSAQRPKILLLSPAHIDPNQPLFAERSSEYNEESARKSHALSEVIRDLADKRGVMFADAAQVAKAGEDGGHLTLDSQKPLAELVASKVRHGESQ